MVNNTDIDGVYSSLSDPVRREIIQKIASNDIKLSEIAQRNKISLPAVSKHLKVLEKAQLITRKKEGREYRFTLTEIARFWIKQFENLEKFLKSK